MEKFVPPKVSNHVWATHVAERAPKFKVHANRGDASRAISAHYPLETVTLYNLVDGEWTVSEVWERPAECSRCHGTLMHKRYSNFNPVFFPCQDPSDKTIPAYHRPIVCTNCRDAIRREIQSHGL